MDSNDQTTCPPWLFPGRSTLNLTALANHCRASREHGPTTFALRVAQAVERTRLWIEDEPYSKICLNTALADFTEKKKRLILEKLACVTAFDELGLECESYHHDDLSRNFDALQRLANLVLLVFPIIHCLTLGLDDYNWHDRQTLAPFRKDFLKPLGGPVFQKITIHLAACWKDTAMLLAPVLRRCEDLEFYFEEGDIDEGFYLLKGNKFLSALLAPGVRIKKLEVPSIIFNTSTLLRELKIFLRRSTCPLEDLYIDVEDASSSDLEGVFFALVHGNTSLRKLELIVDFVPGQRYRLEGISAVLRYHKALRDLRLFIRQGPEDACIPLLRALSTNQTLQKLGLSYCCGAGDVCATLLAGLLRSTACAVRYLDLSGTQVGREGALALTTSTSRLQYLDLRSSRIDSETICAMADHSTMLPNLALSSTTVDHSAAEAIRRTTGATLL